MRVTLRLLKFANTEVRDGEARPTCVRKHYLTINFKDGEGKDQAVVFELGKDIVRTTLSIIEARTGKKIQYQDEEARKSGKGGL